VDNSNHDRVPQAAKFGAYEVDFVTGELRKHGLRIKIQERPLRVLQELVERPGELVTRDELRARIWPSDVYVDFDRNLKTAVNKLRTALCDSAESPRYIETLPRRGFRFIAPVEQVQPEAPPAVPVQAHHDELVPPGKSFQPEPARSAPPTGLGSHRVRLALAVAIPCLFISVVYITGHRFNQLTHGEVRLASSSPVRLAVLPFVNLTGDERADSLCEGMTEEMTSELSRVAPRKLDVIARTSAMHYKNTSESVPEIGRELKVKYVLESSVREFGDRVRVTTELVRASDGGHVWTGEYDRELKDVLIMEQELATAVSAEVKVNLAPQASPSRRNARQVDPEAYRNYLLGRYYWNRRTPANISKSVDYFRQAVREDPNFALAYAGLADSLFFADDRPESTLEAKAAARKSMDLDPTLGEPHASLAFITLYRDWDFQLSGQEFRKAIELSPNYATAHHWYAFYLAFTGHLPEAIKELDRALEIDPLSLIIRGALAGSLSTIGQNDRALEESQKVLEMDPSFAKGHIVRGLIYERMHKFPEAIAEFEKARELGLPQEATTNLACVQALLGNRVEAERTIREYIRQAKLDGLPPPAEDIVTIQLALANREQAMVWLEKAQEQRSQILLDLKSDPSYDPLRSDPRFQAIFHKMNFPP
jgi:TolB-like protein/DNA-binding winged helix-turn-helix (wHTH) protein/Tfp pilus assembly protein PilF